MKHILIATVSALALGLSACSHSSGGAMPSTGTQAPQTAQNPPVTQGVDKQAMLDQERIAAAGAWRSSKHPGFLPAQAGPEVRTMGISDHGLPSGVNAYSNRYDYVDASGHYVTVLAGASKVDGSGVVTVVNRSADLAAVSAHSYTVAPTAVKIGAAADGKVQLQTLSGNTRIPFDVNVLTQ